MMQEPAGPAPSGARTPTILPGQEALLAESLQPLQQEPQGPPPPLILGGQPRLPAMDLPPMGEDSPPALGMLDPAMQPPESLPPMELPPVLPQDPAAASMLLEAIPKYLQNQLQRRQYEQSLDVAAAIQEGPARAEGLRTRMLLEPDAPDLDDEIEKAAPFVPKSTAERLRGSRKRQKVLRSEMDQFDQELEEKVRSQFSESVVKRGAESKLAELTGKIDALEKRLVKGVGPGGLKTSEIRRLREEREALKRELEALSGGGLEWSDVGRGAASPFTGDLSVADSMMRVAKEMVDAKAGPYEHGYEGPKSVNPMTDAGKRQEAMLRGITPKLPEGVTPAMFRAALSEQAAKTMARIKGATTTKDLVSAATGMVPWIVGGAGEIAASGKLAQGIIRGSKLLQASPRLAKAVEVGITYAAGPAAIEAAAAAAQPLPGTAQNEVDQIEDKELRDATAGAYRTLQVTQAASLAMLFGFSDVARSFAAGGSLGQMAQRYVEKTTVGRAVGSTLAMAVAAPALTEGSNIALEEVVAATRSGDVTTSDVLADMAAAKNPALVGPARRLLQAKTAAERIAAAKEYALQAAPMAAGVGAIHALAFVGGKLGSRKQMLELNRAMEADVDQMVADGLPEDVGEVVKQKLRQETEQMAPTHTEDRRAQDREVIEGALGKEGGEARILAEQAADELLPDLAGRTVKEKLAAAVEAHGADPDNPARQRDLEVAMRLEEAAAALDKEEAALATAAARRLAAAEDAPAREIDPADGALQELVRHDEAVQIRPKDLDPVVRRVADELRRDWEIVHVDEESGQFTLRALDDGERITVPDTELVNYRVLDDADVPRGTLPEAEPGRTEAAPESGVQNVESRPIRDELFEAAEQLADLGILSQRKLAEKLGVGQRRAAKLFQELEAAGIVERKGKGWVARADRPTKVEALTEPEARQLDLERMGKRAGELVDQIGTEWESTGTTLKAGEASGELGRLIVDWGDLARPDDPEAGSAAIAAQLLRQMPEALRTDETITEVMGFPKEAIPMVRAAMDDPAVREAAQAGAGDAVRPGALDGPRPIDTRLAAKQAVLDPLPAPVRKAWETSGRQPRDPLSLPSYQGWQVAKEAVDAHQEPYWPRSMKHMFGEGPYTAEQEDAFKAARKKHAGWLKEHRVLEAAESEAFLAYNREVRATRNDLGQSRDHDQVAAAEAAYAEWRRDYPDVAAQTHAEFVATERAEVDGILKRLVHPKRRQEALDHLAERWRDLELQDEATALLSLTEDGRKVIARLNELRDAVFVGGAIPDHLLASLETGEIPKPPRRDESGMAFVPNYLGAGWQMLVSQSRRAMMWLRTARRTMASLYASFLARVMAPIRAGRSLVASNWLAGAAAGATPGALAQDPMVAIGGAVIGSGAIPKAWRLAKSLGGSRAKRDLGNLEAWVTTVAPDLHGMMLRGKKRGAKPMSGIADYLSMWRETDAMLMVDEAVRGRAVVEELWNRYDAVFLEDSEASHAVAKWLEAEDDAARAEIGKVFSPKQREIVEAMRPFWQQTRQMILDHLHPDQLVRTRDILPHLRTVNRRLSDAREALRPQLEEALKARAALPRPKKKEKPSQEWRDAENRVRQIQRAIKKYDKDIAKVGENVAKIHGELDTMARQWGVPNYTPHVSTVDPHASKSPDWREAAKRLRETEASMLEAARDWVYQPIPERLRSGHWQRRKGTLEEKGERDPDYGRSMFHYLRELYRLAPAISWYEQNRERLFGKRRVLENEEIERGWVKPVTDTEKGYRSRRVVWVDTARGKGLRADQYFGLGGSVYTLTMEGPDGQTRDFHFRTYGDLQRAKEMSPKALGLDETWSLAEQQTFGHRVLLLPDRSTEANPEQRIRTVETDLVDPDAMDLDGDGIEVDEVTKQLHLPTHSRLHWPSEVYGKLATIEPGKYQRILAQSGRESAMAFARYVEEDILGSAAGKHVLSAAQSFASAFATLQRHKVLGLVNPWSAMKEIVDTTNRNSWTFGLDNAWEAAGWAMEFSKRLHRGLRQIDQGGLTKWLQEHTLREQDGRVRVMPPSLMDAVRTPKEKLDVMPANKRKLVELQDEAFQAYLNTALSGGSVMAHFTPTERRYRYGEKLGGDIRRPMSVLRKLGRSLDQASWVLRGRAQDHSMAQSWLGAYMIARRGGLTPEQATQKANYYAVAASLVGNRSSMAPAMHTAPMQAVRPLAGWMMAQSSVWWRYLFHNPDLAGQMGPPSAVRFAKVMGIGAGRAVTKIGGWFAAAYLLQQIALLFDFDMTRSVGAGASEVPIVGKWLTWGQRQLQAWLGLAASPEDAYKEQPEWRQKAMQMAREHSPELLREWMVRVAEQGGSMPADIPIFPLWGNWIPYQAEAARDWHALFEAQMTGDEKAKRHYWHKSLFANLWFMREYEARFGSEPDPSDENFALLRNRATKITNARIDLSQKMRIPYNMIGQSVEDSAERIERQILAPIRDERMRASTRSASFLAGEKHQASVKALREAERTEDPHVREKLLQVAADRKAEFRAAAIDYAKSHEMTTAETRALLKRWQRVAEQNYLLTAAERDIVNAYSSDLAFRLMANELNKVPLVDRPALSEKRWNLVRSLWFSDADAMRQSLKGASKDTRDKFLQSLRTAKQRWAMEAEGEKAGIR